MTRSKASTKRWQRGMIGLVVACGLGTAPAVRAQDGASRFDIYGFAMMDMGYQTKQNDPDWFDVLRPTKLPSADKQFGEDGRWFMGVRQTRFGVKSFTPTDLGEMRTTFEFELFGTGVDAGQTTLRLRHAYGELGQFGFGQTWSPFMDIDVFPNSIEYWGPNGMVFFRNVQARWMPIQGDRRLTIALERPGASGDAGVHSEFIQQQGLKARFPMPDLSAEYRFGTKRGYVEAAGIVRQIKWDDPDPTAPDISGEATGWGFNLSTNIKTGDRGTVRAAVVYGEGVENYMNDAPADVAVEDSTTANIEGVALPVLGISAFYDITWNERMTSTVGFSMVDSTRGAVLSGSASRAGTLTLTRFPSPSSTRFVHGL